MWPLKRSCPQCRPPKLEHLSRNKVPRGIVDLCPCIKLTQGKKSTLVDYLERHKEHREQERPCLRGIGTCLPPASGPWWHECRAVFSTGMVYTKIHPYLLEAGGLVVIIEYTCNRNLQTWRPGLRLACPHCYLDNWHGNFFFHQSLHSFNLPCKLCVQSRQCRYCSTPAIGASRVRESKSSYLSTFSTERILSDRLWIDQIIFPFLDTPGSCTQTRSSVHQDLVSKQVSSGTTDGGLIQIAFGEWLSSLASTQSEPPHLSLQRPCLMVAATSFLACECQLSKMLLLIILGGSSLDSTSYNMKANSTFTTTERTP